jgi:Ca-activated chloride channel family protein
MNSFRFEHTEYFYILLVIPVIFAVFLFFSWRNRRNLDKWMDRNKLGILSPASSGFRHYLKFFIVVFGLAAIVFAIARPQFGSKLTDVKRQGVEIILALDVSNSMLAEDIQPNRLANAKRAISRLIDQLEDDKIGLIVFAGDAYVQLPITTDFGAAKLFLSSVNTEIVPRQGTSIGAAIDLAAKSFSPAETSKAIIVITDGENHEEGAIEAARAASEKGISVHTIGMGLPQGAPIPIMTQYGQKDYRKDHEGNIVVSKLDENMLQEIALVGKGIYIRSNNSRTGLNTLFGEINKLEKQEIEAKVYSEYEEQFQYPIAIAILFLIIELFILGRKNKWLASIKFYGIDEKK